MGCETEPVFEETKTEYQVQTPVAILAFNRPETTERVFTEIAKVKPKKLLIVADGPRPNRHGESQRCAAVRSIIEQVDWDCEVLKNYSDVNLGCKRRVSSGLDWVFGAVDRAIVLEDDVLPHPTFFRFCDELLDRYADDERVGAICGCNFQNGLARSRHSYYFSRYAHVWGWASWSRVWRHYDVGLKLWPLIREEGYLKSLLPDAEMLKYYTDILQDVYEDRIDTWDYQFAFACWINSALAILPQVNLVSNLGFGRGATHTTNPFSKVAGKPTECMTFPLVHPEFVMRHEAADLYTDEEFGLIRRRSNFHQSRYRYYLGKMPSNIKHLAHLIRRQKFFMALREIRSYLRSAIHALKRNL